MRLQDLAGMRFGRLLVESKSQSIRKSGALWNCVCECGKTTAVDSMKLRKGLIVSCGCFHREMTAAINRSHGLANKSKTYRTWKEMRQRCNNPNNDKYQWYGGRGIAICSRWDSFENFHADMGDRPDGMTIDRIDNDKGYSPDNCRWLPQLEQTRRQAKNKLSAELAVKLKADRDAGMTFQEIGQKYGVSKTAAHRCCTSRTWS